MSFSPTERVQIRKWIGIAEIFHDRDPRVESALTAIENASPEAVVMIQGYLATLAQIEAKRLEETLNCIGTIQVDKIRQDNVRGMMALDQLGRRYVGFICRALGMEGPISDPFASPATPVAGIHPLSHIPPGGGFPS